MPIEFLLRNFTKKLQAMAATRARPPMAADLVVSASPWRSHPVRWIALASALVIAVIIGAVWMLLWDLRQEQIAKSSEDMESLSLALSEQIDRTFQSIDLLEAGVIEQVDRLGVANSAELSQRMSDEDTQHRLKEQVRGLPHVDALIVVNADGRLVNFSRYWPIPDIASATDLIPRFKADPSARRLVADPVRSPVSGQWVMGLAHRLSGPRGEFLGFVLGTMKLSYFEDYFQSVARNHDHSIGVFDANAVQMARFPRDDSLRGHSLLGRDIFKVLAKASHGTVRQHGLTTRGDLLITGRKLAHYPLSIVVTRRLSDALDSWQYAAIYVAGGAALIVLLIAALSWAMARKIWRNVQAQNRRLDTALNSMIQALAMFDGEGRLIICNERYLEMYRLSRAALTRGTRLNDILRMRLENGTYQPGAFEHADRFVEHVLAEIALGQEIVLTQHLNDGRIIIVKNKPMPGGGWVTSHVDVTEHEHSAERMRQMQNFLDMIVENVPVPILVKDVPRNATDAADCRYSLINRAGEDLFGVSRDELIGKTAAEIYPKERADFIVAENNETLRSEEPIVVSDHEVHTPANGIRYAVGKSFAVRDDARRPRYLLTVLEDVTDRRRWEQRISRMAHYDALTDLPNRATFNEVLEAAIAREGKSGGALAVLSLDLDGFKEANDTYGHSVGDALLREVAHRLQEAAGTAFVARLGGDEFALIVSDGVQSGAATTVANEILKALAAEIAIGDRKITVGASIGAALYPRDGADAATLMINADIALYQAKAKARGTMLFFVAEMGESARERRALQLDLAGAIERNELTLHYQPQKTMAGETVGFEALLRWTCKGRGAVPPSVFIPIAEESGLIHPIGEWVMREACREAAQWPSALTVSVNLSPVQFRDRDLAGLVHSILLETGLPPRRLELEITEGVLIDDSARALAVLRRLKALGVRVALDDFGTGYSSLSYLHAFPFDKIKIDRTFVGDIETNQHSIAIVRAVIDLAQSLGIPVLAEGVETAGQHLLLLRKGCDQVQGYLTGRPQPIETYADLVGRGRVFKPRRVAG